MDADLRSRLGLRTGALFVVVADRDVVIFKVLDAPALGEFATLGGVPGRILSERAEGKMSLVLSPAILASHTRLIGAGDKDLLRVSGWRGMKVFTPRQFLDQHLLRR